MSTGNTGQAADEGVESRLARNGGLSYVQIPAADARQSANFYAAVFGWNIRGDDSHVSFDDGGGHVSGAWITGRAISREPGVLPFIYVDSVDATIEKIATSGGAVVTPPYAEGGLRVATFRDPAGNVIGVWQA